MGNKKRLYLIICIVSFAIVLAALAAIAGLLISYKQASEDYDRLARQARSASPTVQTQAVPDAETGEQSQSQDGTEPSIPLVDIPINFDYLQGENPDIIGWIMVDGTLIDYPILYDTTYNMYYLSHNFEGTATGYGSIFVLGENADDFSDFNTVVYGHNMLDGRMFASLHKFQDTAFFHDHGQIVIYTPDRQLTYQVFAAYRTDNRNIIANNDFSTEELRQEYLDRIYSQADIARFNPDYKVTASDRIVTLSTCIGNPAYRYVVQGVLVSEEMGAYTGICAASEDTDQS